MFILPPLAVVALRLTQRSTCARAPPLTALTRRSTCCGLGCTNLCARVRALSLSLAMASSAHMEVLKAKGLSLDKIEEYKAAFALFDTSGTGRMSVDSLRRVLNDSFEQSYGDEDLQYMMRQFLPGDGSTEVDFPTFALALHGKMGDPRYNEAFGDAFDLFDKGKGGELTKEDLVYGMAKLGEKLTDAEAEEMLKIAKKKDDFVRVMTSSMTAAEAMAAGGGGGGGAAAAAAPSGAAAAAPAPAAGGAGGAGPPRPGACRRAGPRPPCALQPRATAAAAAASRTARPTHSALTLQPTSPLARPSATRVARPAHAGRRGPAQARGAAVCARGAPAWPAASARRRPAAPWRPAPGPQASGLARAPQTRALAPAARPLRRRLPPFFAHTRHCPRKHTHSHATPHARQCSLDPQGRPGPQHSARRAWGEREAGRGGEERAA